VKNKKIIFAGTPEFAEISLAKLLDNSYNICAVYTQPDRPAGRGRKLQASPVKKLALKHNIPVYQPKTLKTRIAKAEFRSLQADLMIVAAYGLILPQAVLDAPQLGCINVHGSLLPRWRGAAPIHRALLANDKKTGITIMQMDAGLDTGDMLLKSSCEITNIDTAATLHDKLSVLGAETLIKALEQFNALSKIKQDESLVTYAHKLDKAESQLDWSQTAEELNLKVRAFNSWPIATTELNNIKLRIWEAEVISSTEVSKTVKNIVKTSKFGIDITTGQGILRLKRVQKAGGKIISAADLLNSNPELKVSSN
jgi:methionyl-tRNA formyltransferase